MARPLRIEFAGALYHITARGNARGKVVFVGICDTHNSGPTFKSRSSMLSVSSVIPFMLRGIMATGKPQSSQPASASPPRRQSPRRMKDPQDLDTARAGPDPVGDDVAGAGDDELARVGQAASVAHGRVVRQQGHGVLDPLDYLPRRFRVILRYVFGFLIQVLQGFP